MLCQFQGLLSFQNSFLWHPLFWPPVSKCWHQNLQGLKRGYISRRRTIRPRQQEKLDVAKKNHGKPPEYPELSLILVLLGGRFNNMCSYLDVSEYSGTPKSSILIGFSIINHPFWGTPIFGNTHLAEIHDVSGCICIIHRVSRVNHGLHGRTSKWLTSTTRMATSAWFKLTVFGMVKTWPLERLSDLQLGDKHVILNHLMLLHYLVRKWISACILMIHSPEKWWLGELPILRGYATFREVFFGGGWDMVKGTPNPQVLKGQKEPTLLTKVVADWWSTMSSKVNCSLDVPFDAPHQKNLLNMDTGPRRAEIPALLHLSFS